MEQGVLTNLTTGKSLSCELNYIEQNGYMEDATELTRPPFDKPQSFIKMFDPKTRTELLATIDGIKKNATEVVA